jgi:prepilin-type N-terminal cleavage/methylation domain-containing protein
MTLRVRIAPLHPPDSGNAEQAFTLVEVLMSLFVGAILVGGLITGYVLSSRRAEWSAYSLAAQALAIEKIEQTRAAKWDLQAYPIINDLRSDVFPPDVQVLDIPVSGTNTAYATNFTTIVDVPGSSPLKFVQVDCVWQFAGGRVFTNTIATYRAPDQ